MKKSILIAGIALFASFTFSSCEKQRLEKELQKQTIERTLKVNESVSFSLPLGDKDDAYQLTTPASHASISRLSVNSDGSTEYLYTPENNYVGQDVIVITTIENEKNGGHSSKSKHNKGNMKGGCSGKHEGGGHYEVTVNLTIEKEVSKIITSTKASVGSN
jgi:hypothetical protein